VRLALEAAGAILAIAVTLYCFGFVLLNVAEFLLLPVRVLAAILN
jgi:hypothetical protein